MQPLPLKEHAGAPFIADLTINTQQLFFPQFRKGLTNTNSESTGWEEGHLQNVWFALVQFV